MANPAQTGRANWLRENTHVKSLTPALKVWFVLVWSWRINLEFASLYLSRQLEEQEIDDILSNNCNGFDAIKLEIWILLPTGYHLHLPTEAR
jgi:hypothetical protein